MEDTLTRLYQSKRITDAILVISEVLFPGEMGCRCGRGMPDEKDTTSVC